MRAGTTPQQERQHHWRWHRACWGFRNKQQLLLAAVTHKLYTYSSLKAACAGAAVASVAITPSYLPASLCQATFVRDLPPISEETAASYDHRYQARAETLLAVDDMIEAVIKVGGPAWHVNNKRR